MSRPQLQDQLGFAAAVERFADELDNSVANLAMARAAQPPPDGGAPTLSRLMSGELPDPLAFVEQLVVDGHPLHPCCRTRVDARHGAAAWLSPDDVRAYAPEYRPIVALELFEVPVNRWFSPTGSRPVLPMHPWQAAWLAEHAGLRRTGEVLPARPLMGLRTLSLVDDPGTHLKTSLTVQMTSVVRTLSGAAVCNGPVVSRLLATIAPRVPGFEVMPEVASGAVLDGRGEPDRELTYVRRSVPPLGAREVALPLASLAASSVADGRPLVCEVVEAGYGGDGAGLIEDLARVVLPPLLALLRSGVALEAHGQNTLVVLRDHRPVRLLYRDMGGIRISPALLSKAGFEAPPLQGDLESDDPDELRTKLFAAVFVPVAEVISVLGRAYALAPQRLWELIASTVDDPLLRSTPELPVKATTAMRLAADPRADLWTYLPNPMAA